MKSLLFNLTLGTFLTLSLFYSSICAGESKTVRLLTIGNSFADNALTYLPAIVESDGQTLIVSRANLGGCTMERHWKHVAAFEEDPGSKNGSPYQNGKSSLDSLLRKEPWDFITIQQVSTKSHDPATYRPFANDLHQYIKERAPDSQIMLHQIWAYRVDDPRFVAKNEGKLPHTHEIMYQQVRKAYHTLAEELNTGIIPSGDAMYLADIDPKWGYRPDTEYDFANPVFPNLPKQTHSLHTGWHWRKSGEKAPVLRIDGHHASNAGKYLLGCLWYEMLFDRDVTAVDYVPEGIDKAYAAHLRKIAHQAAEPFRKAGE